MSNCGFESLVAGDGELFFDTNGDGKLISADAAFARFKVLVTNADGPATVRTLAQLGITEINLTEGATRVELADGSVIEGQTTFKKSDGSTGRVASTALMAEAGFMLWVA